MRNIFRRSVFSVLLVAVFAAGFVSCDLDDDDNSNKKPKDADYSIVVRFDETKINVKKGFIDKEKIENNSEVKAYETLTVEPKLSSGKTVDYWKINGAKDSGKNVKGFTVNMLTKDDCISQDESYVYAIEFVERDLYTVTINYDNTYVECKAGSGISSKVIESGETVSEADASTIYFNLKEDKITSDWKGDAKTYVYGYSLDGGTTEVYYPTTYSRRFYSLALADFKDKTINFKLLTRTAESTTVSFGSELKVTKKCYNRNDEIDIKTEDVTSGSTPIYEGEIIEINLASGEKADPEKIYVNGTCLNEYRRCPFLCDGKGGTLKIIYSSSKKIKPAKDGTFLIEYRN